MRSRIYLVKGKQGDLFGARLLEPKEPLTNGDNFEEKSVAIFALQRSVAIDQEFIVEGNLAGTRLAVYPLGSFLKLKDDQKFAKSQVELDSNTIRAMQGHFAPALEY